MSSVTVNFAARSSTDLDYDPAKTYNKGDLIMVGNQPRIAKEDGITGPFNTDKWKPINDIGVYRAAFAAADWTDDGAGYMTISIPYATHGEDSPEVEVFEGGRQVELDEILVSAGSDVTLKITKGAEFSGTYQIS